MKNKGTTFEPIFGGETTIISGEIDIGACNPDIIWVGTDDQRIRHYRRKQELTAHKGQYANRPDLYEEELATSLGLHRVTWDMRKRGYERRGRAWSRRTDEISRRRAVIREMPGL